MSCDRRDLLAGFTAFLGVALAAPLARALTTGIGFDASHAVFNDDQRTLLAAISERIVPTTDTPGAIAAGVPAFMEMMLADWYAQKDADDFLMGLKKIDEVARDQYGKAFQTMSPEQQDAILSAAMKGAMPGLPRGFFEHCRQMVLLGYYTSEIGATQERKFLPLPGHYDGAYPYAQVGRVFSS